MANYYHNKLIIQGTPSELKLFKEYIGKNITNDFSMSRLYPCPVELEMNASKATEWMKEMWGCKADMRDVAVLLDLDDKLIIHYLTPWTPNDHFIWFLSKIFPSLVFKLIYFEGLVENAGILIMYKDEWWEDIPLSFNTFDFVKNKDDQKYKAIEFDRENINNENYDNCISVDIIGGQWEEALEDSDLNADTVSNWDDFIHCIDGIKKGLELYDSLGLIGGLTDTKIYFAPEPPHSEKVIPPPLPVSTDGYDLPF